MSDVWYPSGHLTDAEGAAPEPNLDLGKPWNGLQHPHRIPIAFLVESKSAEEDSEYDEPKEPMPKRLRAAQVLKATPKKQVRGKQGRLAGLMKMPIDIFTEVSSGSSKYLEHGLTALRSHCTCCQVISLC